MPTPTLGFEQRGSLGDDLHPNGLPLGPKTMKNEGFGPSIYGSQPLKMVPMVVGLCL